MGSFASKGSCGGEDPSSPKGNAAAPAAAPATNPAPATASGPAPAATPAQTPGTTDDSAGAKKERRASATQKRRASVAKVLEAPSPEPVVVHAPDPEIVPEEPPPEQKKVLGRKTIAKIRRMSVKPGATMQAPPAGTTKVDDEELQMMKEDFDACDTEGKGFLDLAAVQAMMEKEAAVCGGAPPTETAVKATLDFFDCIIKDGKVTFEEYCQAMLGMKVPEDAASPREPSESAAKAKVRSKRASVYKEATQAGSLEAVGASVELDSDSKKAVQMMSEAALNTTELTGLEMADMMSSIVEDDGPGDDAAPNVVVTELDEEDLEELQRDFDDIDLDKSGFLTRNEIAIMMKTENMGQDPSEEQVDKMMTWLDCIEGNGKISFEAYVQAMTTSSPP